MIFLPLLQFAALTSEDVWAAAAVFEELRLLFPIRVRRDGGVGGGWKEKIQNIEGASTIISGWNICNLKAEKFSSLFFAVF